MNEIGKYSFRCNLTLGDIYLQVVVWLGVIFASLASALALMSRPLYSFAAVGLIVVVSLPFLLFAFVTTLFNHIEITPVEAKVTKSVNAAKPAAPVTKLSHV
ncbi:hypothetical protein Syn7502_00310 [Synechococcus sp. PCC 7502]|uniref:hypothetical protein n=1 Tax=Synechococcus sp. PCC 7502 TaxID=1173263 RepID=UPI00029FA33A|nr:hypothetical protein [Synechococcus sp. PCC 7502]AFY72477.1 hypothetical protein Syn7502_00310 [Synechococcus sp. PCC 7502]